MTETQKGHTVKSYDRELHGARAMVLAMGERVSAQAHNSIVALINGDLNLAHKVVDNERRIDHFELEIDEAIFNLIAKRQPVARDLRLILALSKVVGELERAGDKAEQIAECGIRLIESEGPRLSSTTLHHVDKLGQLSYRALRNSLRALAEDNVDIALDVFEQGTQLRDYLDVAMRHVVTHVPADVQIIAQVLDVVFVLHSVGNLGEKAGNIAEQVIFVAKGTDIRYQNKEILIGSLRRPSGR